jgi:hypothetical protein
MLLSFKFIGMTGLSLIILNPADRHMILDPMEQLEMKTVRYDAVGDTLQLLIGMRAKLHDEGNY